MRRAGAALRILSVAALLAGTRLDDSGFDPGVFRFRPPAAEGGMWGPVLDWKLQGMHLIVLRGAVVLVGNDGAGSWDPTGGGPPMRVPFPSGDLRCAAQVTLADGRAIMVGGQKDGAYKGIPVTAIFDPVGGTWTRAANMHAGRWYPTATALSNGRLLVTAGKDPFGGHVTMPEIYDPGVDSWTMLPAAGREQPLYPFMFLLSDGRLFEAGPDHETWFLDLAGGGHWRPGPRSPLTGPYPSAVMYEPDRILVAGGGRPATRRAAILDLTVPSPSWRPAAPMGFPRRYLTLTLLADGSVLAAGGSRNGNDPRDALYLSEIWDPEKDRWTKTAPMGVPRMYHSTSALLPDGRVLVAGGDPIEGRLAQIYSPPYLFRGPRPRLESLPAATVYGEPVPIGTPDAARVTRVALVRPAAVTHGFDHDQRYVPLGFRRTEWGLLAVAPADGNSAPPGDYLLFLVDERGVPSEGRWIRVGRPLPLVPGSS